MPGNLLRQRVGDKRASPLLILHPCRMRQRHPHRTPIHQEFDVHSIGMASGNRDDQSLIQAMDRLLGPAVSSSEVSKHKLLKLYPPAQAARKRKWLRRACLGGPGVTACARSWILGGAAVYRCGKGIFIGGFSP